VLPGWCGLLVALELQVVSKQPLAFAFAACFPRYVAVRLGRGAVSMLVVVGYSRCELKLRSHFLPHRQQVVISVLYQVCVADRVCVPCQ
jgi:hypothetical protein